VGSILSKVILPGTIIPIGIVTSLVGIPFFLWLILSRKGTVMVTLNSDA
jgi:iron complex transport system permease protein